MPRAFFITVDCLALVGGPALVVWWFAHRARWANEPPNLLFKSSLSLFLLALLIELAHRVGFTYGGAFAVPFAAVLFGVLISITWAPHVGDLLARPITSLFDGGNLRPDPQPLYSIAEAKRKKGEYNEAVFAIHQELQKFPNDVTGQIMLAGIQAENLNDLH